MEYVCGCLLLRQLQSFGKVEERTNGRKKGKKKKKTKVILL